MRVVLYIRVSTEEQAAEGYSIRAQRAQLIDYCRVHDYEITNIHVDDGYSAKDTNRPQLKIMLADAQKGLFDAVVVYKLDRFTRSAKDLYGLLEQLQTYKVDFISKQEKFDTSSAMGRALLGLLVVFAQFERETTAERVRMGQEQKVREGKKPGGRYPFGYDKQGNLVPEEAEAIRRLRELYMKENLGFKSIVIRLNQEGLLRRGFEWRASTAALTLENPFYAGIIQFGGKMANGKYPARKRELRVDVLRSYGSHEPIFSEEEYNEHLRLMRMRTDDGYSRKRDYWFTGLLRCGKCGYSMHGRISPGRIREDGTRANTPYYICSRRKENDRCQMPIIRQTHVEHLIMEHISKVRFDRPVNAAERRRLELQEVSREKTVQKLKSELEGVKERVKKWQYMFVQDLVKAEDLRIRLDEEYARETVIKNQIEELRSINQTSQSVNHHLIQMMESWPEMVDAEKQEVLSLTFEEIHIFTDEEKPKGVKNKFYDARIQVKYR